MGKTAAAEELTITRGYFLRTHKLDPKARLRPTPSGVFWRHRKKRGWTICSTDTWTPKMSDFEESGFTFSFVYDSHFGRVKVKRAKNRHNRITIFVGALPSFWRKLLLRQLPAMLIQSQVYLQFAVFSKRLNWKNLSTLCSWGHKIGKRKAMANSKKYQVFPKGAIL